MAEPTQAEIIREALDSRLLDVHVALPARVESYDPATLTVEVLPMVRRAILDTENKIAHEDIPKIPNVPVLFPNSTAFSATWPLQKGDFVLLVFNEAAIGQWRETGDISNPGDIRRHDLSYPVAIPGIKPKTGTTPTAPDAAVVEVGAPATHVTFGAGASEFVSLSNFTDTFIQDIVTALNAAVPTPNDGGAGLITTFLAALSSAGWGGGGTTLPNSTAASKLKSE